MADDIPTRIQRVADRLTDAKSKMTDSIREVSWAYADLSRMASPDHAEQALSTDQALSELAVRGVMPHRLPEIIRLTEEALGELKALVTLIPPLATKDKTNG